MNELLNALLPVASLLVGAIGTLIGVLAYSQSRQKELRQQYADAQQKKYAAERDFAHLQRNYEQLIQSFNFLSQELDRRFDAQALEDKELKSLLNIVLLKLSGEGTSGYRVPRE